MMESLGAPQTHVALKGMIKEIDDDNDGEISLREFFMIFKKAALGELQAEGLTAIADSVNVSEVYSVSLARPILMRCSGRRWWRKELL